MTAPLVFIAANHRECTPWVAKWDSVQVAGLPVRWSRSGKWQGRDVIAISNGIGPERAQLAVAAVAPLVPAALISIGTCGALDAALQLGDIFIPTEIRGGGQTWPVRLLAGPVSKNGPLISVTRIAASASEKRELRATGALAVEMESAGVARAASRLNVPFYCVRAVSDLADEDFANDFNKILMPDGRLDIPALLFSALARPLTRLPELARLARGSALASKNMGEFLALCSF